MTKHDKHYVTTKAAIYSHDGKEVLVTKMFHTGRDGHGLPGGHIDGSETPDEAMARELDEELGVSVTNLIRTDFFVHENGKIVLGYVGTLARDTKMNPSEPTQEIGEWLDRPTFENVSIDRGYKAFVLANWPR